MAIRISWREHIAKDGTKTTYARYKEPRRVEGGAVELKSVERSIGTRSKREGAKLVEEWYKQAVEKADAEPKEIPTFAEIAVVYQRTQGASIYFVPILEKIGNRLISEIDQNLMTSLATEIYPNRTAATINRQLFTPVKAALRLSGPIGIGIAATLKRPKGHDSLPDLDVPKNDWFRAVLPHANPWLRAFLICGRLHGRRPGEYLNRKREHFDAEARTLLVRDNKGKQNIVINLAEPAWAALMALPDLAEAEKIRMGDRGKETPRLTKSKRGYLFGTKWQSTMRNWLLDACKEAGVPYHMAKEAGRHAFVTGHLSEGKSLKWVQDAGHWKTITAPAHKYSHLEKQEVHRQAKDGGESWFSNNVGKVSAGAPLLIVSGENAETEVSSNRGDEMGTNKERKAK
ncbi:hypothetical protein [Hyphomicrobium sp. DY-1]|uniref:hypothetical protein n=1 Tax=Hyphomicrobium sp. DY-1 TaxID=3075650 RepID=UPI0039C421B4